MVATKTKCRKKTAAAACTKKKVAKKNCPKPAKKRKPTNACSKPKKKTRRKCTPCIMVNPDYLARHDDYFPHADVTFADEIEEKTDEIYRGTFPSTEERTNMPETVPETVPREKLVWAKPVKVTETVQKSPPVARKQVHPEFILPTDSTFPSTEERTKLQHAVPRAEFLDIVLDFKLDLFESKLDELDSMLTSNMLLTAISSKHKDIFPMMDDLDKFVRQMDPKNTDPDKLNRLTALKHRAQEFFPTIPPITTETVQTPLPGARKQVDSEIEDILMLKLGHLQSKLDELDDMSARKNSESDALKEKDMQKHLDDLLERAISSKQKNIESMMAELDNLVREMDADETDPLKIAMLDALKERALIANVTFISELLGYAMIEMGAMLADELGATTPASFDDLPDKEAGESIPNPTQAVDSKQSRADTEVSVEDSYDDVDSEDDNEDEGDEGSVYSDGFEEEDPAISPTSAERDQNKGESQGISSDSDWVLTDKNWLLSSGMMGKFMKVLAGMSTIDIWPHSFVSGFIVVEDIQDCKMSEVDYDTRVDVSSCGIQFTQMSVEPLIHEMQSLDEKTRVGFVIFQKESAADFGLEANQQFIVDVYEQIVMKRKKQGIDPYWPLHLVFIDADEPNQISMLSKYGGTLLKTTNVSMAEPFDVTAFADRHWR